MSLLFEEDRSPYYTGMPSDKYWQLRSKEILTGELAKARGVEKYITKINKESLEQYLKDYTALMKPFIKHGELDFAKLEQAKLYDYSFADKVRRIEKEIDLFSSQLSDKEIKAVTDLLVSEYKDVYSTTLGEFKHSSGLMEVMNKKAVEQMVKTPFRKDGKEFSTRIWTNKQNMDKRLKSALSNAIANGEPIDKTARKFRDIMGNTTYNSQRIIRTETIRCYGEASKSAYEDSGVVDKIIVLETATACPICSKHANVVHLLSDVEVGVNVPPYHPNCKGTIAPYFGSRKAKSEWKRKN